MKLAIKEAQHVPGPSDIHFLSAQYKELTGEKMGFRRKNTVKSCSR